MRHLRRALFTALTLIVAAFASRTPSAQPATAFDVVLAGGRVMDPATRLDAVRHVGVRGSEIAAVSTTPLRGTTTLDVSGLVVAPGFIDPHAHAQTMEGNRFQARDGVTTALELESGALPIDEWYRSREGKALLNYGATAGHIYSRIAVMHAKEHWSDITATRQDTSIPRADWAYRKASPPEVDGMLAHLERNLAAGALGIGMGPMYTPGAGRDELFRVFELAARHKALAFIHMRAAGEIEPGGSIDALQEVLANVAATGASVHIVHITSMGLGQTSRLLQMIDGARARGLDVTTELYPYTAASTYIQSALFDPGWQERFAIDYGDVQWAATGERLTAETFNAYRTRGGLVVIHMIPDAALRAALTHPDVMIGSDGVPLTNGGGHPRGIGTYARVLGRYVRDEKLTTLEDAIRRLTSHPAAVLNLRERGSLKEGYFADIVVFDPARIQDHATFEKPHQYATGVSHVIVNGELALENGEPTDARPGRFVRGRAFKQGEKGGCRAQPSDWNWPPVG
jgi:N-acyl-D-aspartate/D-glutamate deacylase